MIKVFIIDDSILIRNMVKKLLKPNEQITVIGEAPNPVDAMSEFKEVGLPDVFILDIEMPKMDGVTFLKKLQKERPIPTVVFSSVVGEGSTKAVEALSAGACDIILKPLNMQDILLNEMENEFVLKIKSAASSNFISKGQVEKKDTHNNPHINKVVAIGASTGGVQTLEEILVHLNVNHPPILIVQHMPVGFTASFAKRLDKMCKNSTVVEAKNGDMLENSMVFISPGDLHLEVEKTVIDKYKTVLKNYPKVSNHKPSVDVLFKSISKEVKENAIAFILTGMGRDGALGIKKVHDAKGATYGQDEQSSIVYGMPRVAFEMSALDRQVSINDIVNIINNTE
ncbi:chemotaxis-specific protein-glutamate methyltransferase CheB [Sulfurimonas sp.]